MMLQMIGCSHQTADVQFRERISFNGDQVNAALLAFQQSYPGSEVVLLSTCNRVELYTVAADGEELTKEQIAGFIAEQHGLPANEVLSQMTYLNGSAAVEHLFTVAASLDSMVLGEAQILSQVKQAYDVACATGSAGPMVHSVFQAANRTAKRVQQETLIHRRRVSVPSVAVGEVVPEVFDSLSDKRVVLCGAGEMCEETLRYLKQADATNLCVINRSFERAVALSKAFATDTAMWSALADEIVEADLLIGTTSSPDPIVTADQFQTIHAKRQGRILLILDLAVPRDFDPAIGDFSGVYLYQIDDLQAACEKNRREREKEWPKARKIIAEESQRFVSELNARATGPIVRRLREQAEQLKRDELERLMSKLSQGDMNGSAAKEIEKSFDRLINKILHPPLASIRDDAEQGHRRGLLDALRHLFNLGDEP